MVQPVSEKNPQSTVGKRLRPSRLVLLSTVAAVALGGAVLGNGGFSNGTSGAIWSTPANAETGSVASLPANAFSFADVVDHVRNAVVSIKVKISEVADTDESDEGGPQLSPDDPLEKFFRRFGGEEGQQFEFHHSRPHTSQFPISNNS